MYELTQTSQINSETKNEREWINTLVRTNMMKAILFIVVSLLIIVAAASGVVIYTLDHASTTPPASPPASPAIFDLITLPRTYDAELHPIRRVVLEHNDMQQSINIIGTKLYNNSYMELYSEYSIVIHVHVDESVQASFPDDTADDVSPFVSSLMEFSDETGENVNYTTSLSHSRRELRLRIGRFYICIFCRGSWGCRGNLRKGKLKVGCTRLIAVGFDAEK